MLPRFGFSLIGIGSVSAAFLYHLLDYHYVPVIPPIIASSTTDTKNVYVPRIPVTMYNKLDYSMYDEILSQYVENGKVKYIELRKSMLREKRKDSLFIKWLLILSKYGPNSVPNLFSDKNEELKYYLNAYNVLVIYGVLYHSFYYKRNHSLISSVMDIKSRLEFKNGFGFFKAPMYELDNDKTVSLDDLEHNIIRNKFNDARIHCAINCASIGCPKLQSFVIKIEDLDYLCKQFVNEEKNVYIDTINNKIKLSKIFESYHKDFILFYDNRNNKNHNQFQQNKLLYFIWKYGNDDLRNDINLAFKQNFEIEWIPYKWNLNKYPIKNLHPKF